MVAYVASPVTRRLRESSFTEHRRAELALLMQVATTVSATSEARCVSPVAIIAAK
jgi:hypothetical protein